jgi:predicted Zn-dependent peptidase
MLLSIRTTGRLALVLASLAVAGCASQSVAPVAAVAPPVVEAPARPLVNIVARTLGNGLKVVLAPDPSVPTATVGVYYNVGSRVEAEGRSGYAHLFEHLMFQASANLPKGAFNALIESSGGVLNGSTHKDFTNYYQVVPSNLLETVLWAEADRMKGLAITAENLKNQQDVVINELKVRILNRPYGEFMWIDVPRAAFRNYANAHSPGGSVEDVAAATLPEAVRFHEAFYPPNNAALVIAGDIDVDQAWAWVQKYFGPIPPRPVGARPDLAEPPQTAEIVVRRVDKLAPRPALALAYHAPARGTPAAFALDMIQELLAGGDDSRLVQKLVREKGYTSGVRADFDQFSTAGPELLTFGLIHDPAVAPETIIADVDAEIAALAATPVADEELARIRTRIRSALYDMVGSSTRFGLVDLLGTAAIFDNDPAAINRIEAAYAAVTPALIQQTVARYLVPAQRTVMIVEAGAAPPAATQGGGQ